MLRYTITSFRKHLEKIYSWISNAIRMSSEIARFLPYIDIFTKFSRKTHNINFRFIRSRMKSMTTTNIEEDVLKDLISCFFIPSKLKAIDLEMSRKKQKILNIMVFHDRENIIWSFHYWSNNYTSGIIETWSAIFWVDMSNNSSYIRKKK